MRCHRSLPVFWLLVASTGGAAASPASPLVTLEYRVAGAMLQVSPAAVSVPKGIPGSVWVSVLAGGSATNAVSAQLSAGAHVEAVLRGPAFAEPRRLVGLPNAALMLPPINLVGDYQLDQVRLVDSTSGATRLEGIPARVPVRVFDEVLISRVTSRPLTLQEIQDKGIVIDEANFRAVEFEVAVVLEGKTIPITFPVVAPRFTESTELIPAAELEARLKDAAALNQQIAQTVELPPEFETAALNFQIQGINFQVVDESGGPPNLALAIPPIPALMVIPGNIGFLNQFFSVQILTENGAPIGSGLLVSNIQARLILPPGPDRIASTNYAQPGDDPLRFARIGPDQIIQPVQPILKPGPDGQRGTADDIGWLMPGDSGQAEFLVEGLQEGLHVMDLDLSADLHGLAAGVVRVQGKAAGSVLVRNPRFSFAFAHPRTVRAGEPYEASITVLNTGITPANLVSVTLNRNAVSGATFEPGQEETIQLGTILPGQSATATYRLRAQRTGAVSFSNLSTSEDSVVGRFRFSMGIDERGVALSPDTLAMPDYVNELPGPVLAAATRVLGQALSVATAAQLPSGVQRIPKSVITRRVLELAEAGQRLRYGDGLNRVLPDLLRDWQGGRYSEDGFDQLLRETNAGQEWRAALFGAIESADVFTATQRLLDRAQDLAGLGQQFVVASADLGQLRADFGDGAATATLLGSTQPYALVYGGSNGLWAVTPPLTNAVFVWTFTNGPPSADIAVLLVGADGQAHQYRWQLVAPLPQAVYRFALGNPAAGLQVDLDGDGSTDLTMVPSEDWVSELPPMLLAVQQDLTVLAGRPANPCIGPAYRNYGTVLAVMFSKPVTQAGAGAPESYQLDGDNGANSVQVQPSGRVALLNLRKGVSAIRPRSLTVTNIADARGNRLAGGVMPVRCVYPGLDLPFTGGVAVRGRVLRGDGSPAAGVPVTLTMYDRVWGLWGCTEWTRRVSQVLTDSGGNFEFDFVMAGIPYSISATDTGGLPGEALALIMEATLKEGVNRQRIEELANSPQTANTLLGWMAAGSLPEAIAKVEGLDRAIVRDWVPIGSPREGQQVPVVLRFRGRATVVGQVVGADGRTPVPNAAVNLFPDPDSREQGRGIFADQEGRFAFYGVPLGVFTVDVKTADQRARTVNGLLDTPGQVQNLVIALPSGVVAFGTLRGRIFESDNLTPHGHGRVFIGAYQGDKVTDVVRIVEADADGFWQAPDVAIRSYDLVAVTFDGQRKGLRLSITPMAGLVTDVNITLESVTRVFGRVQFDDGRPAANALVAGGVALVRADANGNFELEGVPVGWRIISAGLERNPAAGIDFPRLGSTHAHIVAGAANYVVVKLRAAGRIFGKVVNAQGQPVPNIRVAIPVEGGFYWTDADAQGNYVFENLGLGRYTLSAPANAVAPQLNESELIAQIRSGDEDQILAAFEEAIRVFVGAEDPVVTGEHERFRPSSWGFTTAQIRYDNESVNADIRFLVQGTVSGRVLNHQGVPIGARVRLTGLGPSPTGQPTTTIRGERDSDPATGQFSFPNQLLAGPWGLQVASPFYPVVLSTNGFTTEINPDVTNVVLQFPAIREVNGRIAGRVVNPDGSPAGAGVRVKINLSEDYEIQTDTNGLFDTQMAVPALGRSYVVEAFDPVSGLRGRSGIDMTPGITNWVEVRLLTRNSGIDVIVLRGGGLPATNAWVTLNHGSYPFEPPLYELTDPNGFAHFDTLWEGSYAVSAEYTEAATRVGARAGVTLGPNVRTQVTLRLGGTGSIEGRFVKRDFVTPVYGAQVAIGTLGFATTDTNGYFRFDGVPLGTYRIVSADPVSGAAATATATLTVPDQVQIVHLIEAARGEINGLVLDGLDGSPVPGASVRASFSDGLTPARTVTTGPDGRFTFAGSPAGGFSLLATYTLVQAGGLTVSGQASGVLPETASSVSVNIQLQPLAVLPVQVLREDGTNPAPNTRVALRSGGLYREQDTGDTGELQFNYLPLGHYTLLAVSHQGGQLHNGVEFSLTLSTRGTQAVVRVVLPGIGRVEGVVLDSDGLTPVQHAEVQLTSQRAPFAGEVRTSLTGPDGRFGFDDVPVGPYRITASSRALAASLNEAISAAGEIDTLQLRLGDSGSIRGTLVRADGVTVVGGVDVLIEFAAQSANPGRASFRTTEDGVFRFDHVPLGAVHVSAAAPAFGGIIDFDTALTVNGQELDLGNVRFDEDLPQVLQVHPPHTATEVPITTSVELLFNEALDPQSIRTDGIFIRGPSGTVASTVTLLPDSNGVARLVRITPRASLVSKRTYEVVVLSGELTGAGGGVIGAGPRDLVGRPMAAPFFSQFTTADNDPPVLLSVFPADGAVQIDPRAVPRLSFNETVRPSGFVFIVVGPDGLVPGTASVGVNGQVLSFVPAAELLPNATYTLIASNIFDLAGNRAAGEPFTARFATLDTLGPGIATLQLASNAVPVAGATVWVEAILDSTNEPGASVRFTQDFNPIGADTNAPFQVQVQLPLEGTTTIRAIATDRFGNDGPVAELVIVVEPRQPPTVQITLLSPTNGLVLSGSAVIAQVNALGHGGPFQITAIVAGAATGALATATGTVLTVEGFVPGTATAQDTVLVLAQATDPFGLSSGQQVLTLPIFDATPPALAILSPANEADLPPDQPLALELRVSDNSSNVALEVVITGSLQATQRVSLTLVPNAPTTNFVTIPLTDAPTNGGPIWATVTGSDADTNRTQLTRRFWLPGTVGPSIAVLRIANNVPPLAGSVVPIEALLATSEPGAVVRFTQDGTPLGTATNPPYRVQVTLPMSGDTVIAAVASDPFGHDGPMAELRITVRTNRLPTIEFVRVSPATGPVPSGSAVVVDVVASGVSDLFHITAQVGGAATGPRFSTDGVTLRVQGWVPASALAGQEVLVSAEAIDGLGQSSGTQVLRLPVSDGTAPSVTISSPPNNAQLVPGQPLNISTVLADNSSNLTVTVTITGGVTSTQTVNLQLTPNTPAPYTFIVPLPDAPTNGSPVWATVLAADVAGNTNSATRLLWLPGTETTVTWHRQALGQTFTCTNTGRRYSWPNNNSWSQSARFGDPCSDGSLVMVEPSNWSTTNCPNSNTLDVVLGSLGGAPVTLDLNVFVHSVTIQPDGGLNMNSGTELRAVNFEFQGDGTITVGSCCAPPRLVLDGGTMAKSGGAGLFTFNSPIVLQSEGGTFWVEAGTLALPGNGSSYRTGAFYVASNATLVLMPSGQSATFAGTFTGSGQGTVLLQRGTLVSGAGGLTFDLPEPLFQWTSGLLAADNPLTNAGTLTVVGTEEVSLRGRFHNAGLLRHVSTGRLGLQQGARLVNLPSGTCHLETDAAIAQITCCELASFENYGNLRKAGGSSNCVISVLFNNQGGLVEVQTGTLTLANNGTSSNGTFQVAAGAVLDVTGGQQPTWAGLMQGSGAGTVRLGSGRLVASPGVTLDFEGELFQWTGGTLAGWVTNRNVMVLSGTGDRVVNGGLENLGVVRHTGTGRLGLDSGAEFRNLAGAIYDFQDDGQIYVAGCCVPPTFLNQGLVRKSGGTNQARINDVRFNNVGGAIQVEAGRLVLANDGSSTDATIEVAPGAVLDLTGGRLPSWAGRLVGRGGGRIELNNGVLGAVGLTVDCELGLFHWGGGTIRGTLTNAGVMALSGSGDGLLEGRFVNEGTFRQTGSGRLGLASGAGWVNMDSGVYWLGSDAGIYVASCCIEPVLENRGRFVKAAGDGNSLITVLFNNLGGRVEVEAGRLTLANNGTSSNGTFQVAAGAVLDLTGGRSPSWRGRLTGTGAGWIELTGGTVWATDFTLDCAPGLFQWIGGVLRGTVTNAGDLTFSGANNGELMGSLFNAGLVRHTGSAPLRLASGARLWNLPGAEYRLEHSGGFIQSSCCQVPVVENAGLLRKTGSTNATIAVQFNNTGGSIALEGGTLSLSYGNFAQGGGRLIVSVGGRDPGQSGRLVVSGSASLNGPLTVLLTNQFRPEAGDQFEILRCASLTGAFTALDLPPGFAVDYSGSAVVLVVTNTTAPAPLLTAQRLAVDRAGFSFQSISGREYVLERNDDLRSGNWVYVTNFTGNGAVLRVELPIEPVPQRFFRLR